MKKLSIFMALAVALGFSSCSDDNDPVYKAPADGSFVLNTPALADQYFELTEEGTVEFTTSQPDCGFTASYNYSMQMALTADPAEDAIYDLTAAVPTSARIVVKDQDIATGLCVLRGITDKESWVEEPARSVFFRAVAQIPGHDETAIKSNWVELKAVKGFFAIPVPGYIYLIGAPGGWTAPSAENAGSLADWRLFEADDAIGSKVYTGVFDIAEGQAQFRFYTELNGWGDDGCPWGLGSQDVDAGIDFEIEGDKFTHELVWGKGNFNFTNWAGGTMQITVNLASATPEMTIVVLSQNEPPEPTDPSDIEAIYMIGNNAGWVTPSPEAYADWKLTDEDGDGIFSATFAMPADFGADGDVLYCRFTSNPNGWSDCDYASTGGNVDVEFGMAYGTAKGQGCFVLAGAAGNTVNVSLDTNNNEVTFDILL